MKILRLSLAILALAGMSAVAIAACPDSGYFRTYNGTLQAGRASEAWCNGNAGQPGNTENVESWDGVVLGGQWKVWGQHIDANGAVEVANTVDAYGNGYIDYQTNYEGGYIWLTGNHTWSTDGQPLTGYVTYFNVGARVVYQSGQMTGATANVYMTARFDGCEDCEVAYTIANTELVWSSGFGTPAPADYPDFACNANVGEYFYACCIVAAITCDGVPTQTQSWGSVKSLYN
jgi:hypothetical protein